MQLETKCPPSHEFNNLLSLLGPMVSYLMESFKTPAGPVTFSWANSLQELACIGPRGSPLFLAQENSAFLAVQ